MSEIPTWAELRERHLRKAGGADDFSDYEYMKEYSAENPEVPEKKEGEFIHTGVLSPTTTDYDPSKFNPVKNYRHLKNSDYPHYDPDSDDVVWADQTVQMGLPRGGIYASKRNSKGQSHWMKMWHDRQSRWSNPMPTDKYNGYQFNISPQAKVKTINSYNDYFELLKRYPYLSYGGQAVRGLDNIIQHINSDHSAEHWPENWWKRKASIDWEKLNDPETYGDDTYQAVYFTYPAVKEIYEHQHKGPWPAVAAPMDFENDSDHMIILDPSIIQDVQSYISPEFKYKQLRPKTQ